MNVLGIGESVVDIESTSNIEGDSPDGEPDKSNRHVGGPSTAALVVLARLGLDCTYVTSIGDDAEGSLIRSTLSSEGIKLVNNHQQLTKVNRILINALNGQRSKLRSQVRHRPIVYISPGLIRQADIIIVDRHEPEAFRQILCHKRSDTKIITDSSTEVSSHTMNMIRHADYPIVPIETCAQMARHGDLMSGLAAVYEQCQRPIIVTASSLGSLVYDGIRLEVVPSLELNAVAVNGAGDVFRGAFAYGVSLDWDRLKCASFANRVAGLTCLKPGNVSAIPTKTEMLALMDAKMPTRNVSLADVDREVRRLRIEPIYQSDNPRQVASVALT